MNRKPRPRNRLAMTLVEVLVAITIIAIVLPVAMPAVSLAVNLASVTRQRAQATSLAESKLNELMLTSQSQPGNSSGDYGEEFLEHRWDAVVNDWEEFSMSQL